MKIPESLEETEYERSQEKNVNFKEYRKKKKRRKLLLQVLIIVLAGAGLFYVWQNASTIFEPLRGIASKIDTKTSYGVGFPIELPGSSGYSFERFGECFSLLTDTYLYAYTTQGEQLYALKHGYSNPRQTTSDKRILIYDRAAYNFALYSRTSLIFQKTLDDKIVYASIGNSGICAVVTESSKYSDIIYVYDDGGNWKYTRKFADENVMQICCLEDGEHIIVSTVGIVHGDIVTNIYKFSIKSTEGYIWKYSISGNRLPLGMNADNKTVTCVFDNLVLAVDRETGSETGRYAYNGTMLCFELLPDITALLYIESSTNKYVLILLDGSAEQTSARNVASGTSGLSVSDGYVYTLDGTRIRCYEFDGLKEIQSYDLNESYSEFIKIGQSFFMLGYDKIDTLLGEQKGNMNSGK